MQDFSEYTMSLIPFYLVAALVVWSLVKKEKWVASAILGLSFSSGALIFTFVKGMSPRFENFEVGYTIGMYASVVGTIPLAAFGWYLGKKISMRLAIGAAIVGVALNFAVAYTYQYMIKRSAETLKAQVAFDCAKVPYHCAIRDNRLADIPELKKNGQNIESRDSLSRTPLWYGINNEEAVRLLLENGANPDSFNVKAETPLAYVLVISMKPNLPIARLLIKHGANINRTVGFRKRISILNWAIVNGNIDVINFALENGADPNFVDGYKKTACLRLFKMKTDQIPNLKKYCPTLEGN